MVVHLFAPLNLWAALGAFTIAGLGWVLDGKAILASAGSWLRRERSWILLSLLLLAVWTINRSTRSAKQWDAANYHLAMIRWSAEYKIVPGLGNLNVHYAFNSATHLYHGLIESLFGFRRSTHFVYGLLWFWAAGRLLVTLLQLRPSSATGPRVFASVLLTPFLVYLSLDTISEPLTDLPTMMVLLVTGVLFWDKIVFPESEENRVAALVLLPLLCCAAIVTKLAALPFGLLVCLLALLVQWRLAARSESATRIQLSGSILAAVIFLVWMARSVLLSGYPLFPSLILPFNVAWRIPDEYASWSGWWIRTFARDPWNRLDMAEGWSWIRTWVSSEVRSSKVSLVAPILLTCLLLAGWGTGRLRREMRGDPFAAAGWFLSLSVGAAAWFAAAPSTRFGIALLWLLTASLASVLLPPTIRSSAWGAATAIALIALCPLVAIADAFRLQPTFTSPLSDPVALRLAWVLPGPDHGLHPAHEPRVRARQLDTGVVFYVPVQDECPEKDWALCMPWDPPLPGAAQLRELAFLDPRTGPAGGFRMVMPPEGWVAHNARRVQELRIERGWNLRRTANTFFVHPRFILQAQSWNAGLSQPAAAP